MLEKIDLDFFIVICIEIMSKKRKLEYKKSLAVFEIDIEANETQLGIDRVASEFLRNGIKNFNILSLIGP